MTKQKKVIKKTKETEVSYSIKEKEEMIQDIFETNKHKTLYHLNQVKQTTGEILLEDVAYCLDLSERIMNYTKKFL